MHRGLDLARPRRRWRRLLALPLLLALWLALPRLAAAAPAGLARMQGALGDLLLPRYTAELADLRQQNAALHEQLARSADALAENEALRSLVGAGLPTGRWQPARVVARRGGALTLACTAGAGAPLLDPRGAMPDGWCAATATIPVWRRWRGRRRTPAPGWPGLLPDCWTAAAAGG